MIMTTFLQIARSFLTMLKEVGWTFHSVMALCLALSLATSDWVYPAELAPCEPRLAGGASRQHKRRLSVAERVALGVRLHKRGVVRAELVKTLEGLLEERRINLTYKQAILAGYDRGPVAE